MQDFFFGNVNVDSKTRVNSMRLHDAIELASICGPSHFTAQVCRFLREHNQLVMSDGTSHPPFADLLSQLEAKEIGLVRLGVRTDVNDNVPATLECTLVFVEGVVTVRPHWTAYKEIRAWEIVTSLLKPLHQNGLIGRTVHEQDGELKKIGADIESQIRLLFGLSGFPFDTMTHGKMSQYLERFQD
jgi:hypothetical protein